MPATSAAKRVAGSSRAASSAARSAVSSAIVWRFESRGSPTRSAGGPLPRAMTPVSSPIAAIVEH
jgi:hypothetical protein